MTRRSSASRGLNQLLDDIELDQTTEAAFRFASARIPDGSQLDSRNLLAALTQVDTLGNWERLRLHFHVPEESTASAAGGDDAAASPGIPLSTDLTIAFRCLRILISKYDLTPVPPGALLLALVLDPDGDAARLVLEGSDSSHEELLMLIQAEMLDATLEDLDPAKILTAVAVSDAPRPTWRGTCFRLEGAVIALTAAWSLLALGFGAVMGAAFTAGVLVLGHHLSLLIRVEESKNPPLSSWRLTHLGQPITFLAILLTLSILVGSFVIPSRHTLLPIILAVASAGYLPFVILIGGLDWSSFIRAAGSAPLTRQKRRSVMRVTAALAALGALLVSWELRAFFLANHRFDHVEAVGRQRLARAVARRIDTALTDAPLGAILPRWYWPFPMAILGGAAGILAAIAWATAADAVARHPPSSLVDNIHTSLSRERRKLIGQAAVLLLIVAVAASATRVLGGEPTEKKVEPKLTTIDPAPAIDAVTGRPGDPYTTAITSSDLRLGLESTWCRPDGSPLTEISERRPPVTALLNVTGTGRLRLYLARLPDGLTRQVATDLAAAGQSCEVPLTPMESTDMGFANIAGTANRTDVEYMGTASVSVMYRKVFSKASAAEPPRPAGSAGHEPLVLYAASNDWFLKLVSLDGRSAPFERTLPILFGRLTEKLRTAFAMPKIIADAADRAPGGAGAPPCPANDPCPAEGPASASFPPPDPAPAGFVGDDWYSHSADATVNADGTGRMRSRTYVTCGGDYTDFENIPSVPCEHQTGERPATLSFQFDPGGRTVTITRTNWDYFRRGERLVISGSELRDGRPTVLVLSRPGSGILTALCRAGAPLGACGA
ncbi:hypothetical protein [Frankia gtarii]|uniref:hypothetical protein n=1 Tax=Frankia gtarii TaxID=2950102 RepID=UPI0021C243D2|nr:hypothetical protein [Frankia gtarii]